MAAAVDAGRQLRKMRADFMKLGRRMKDSPDLLTVDDVIDMATEAAPTRTGCNCLVLCYFTFAFLILPQQSRTVGYSMLACVLIDT